MAKTSKTIRKQESLSRRGIVLESATPKRNPAVDVSFMEMEEEWNSTPINTNWIWHRIVCKVPTKMTIQRKLVSTNNPIHYVGGSGDEDYSSRLAWVWQDLKVGKWYACMQSEAPHGMFGPFNTKHNACTTMENLIPYINKYNYKLGKKE